MDQQMNFKETIPKKKNKNETVRLSKSDLIFSNKGPQRRALDSNYDDL